jgi:predicted 2-oxoglutarate/Fe(II)-dependent dioxygenase YbiX
VTFSPSLNSPVVRKLTAKIDRYVRPALKNYWHVDHLRQSDTHIVRYVPGGFYVTHADAGLDVNNRYFTVLCYLNDDYEGGRTSFPTLDFSVVPCQGKAIIFPTTYLHRAEPVTAGTKYILVSWLVGHMPPEWI